MNKKNDEKGYFFGAGQCAALSSFKPRSHSAGIAPVHPGEGQPVYRDEPGHFFKKINCVLTVPTLHRCCPDLREN